MPTKITSHGTAHADMPRWFRPKGEPQDPTLEQQLDEYRRALGLQRRY
ncbi:hypothetical protein [Dyella sp. EPa41]|nr:hypothetical protein [Dyella sp. EPa41]